MCPFPAPLPNQGAGLYHDKQKRGFYTGKTSYHNLYFLINLMKNVRQAILDDNLLEFREDFIERYGYNHSKRNF